MKISEKIKEYKKQKNVFYSFEYFPPKTDYGMDNLYSRIDRIYLGEQVEVLLIERWI